MKWKTRSAALDDIRVLQERYDLDFVSARILAGRKIVNSEDVKFYLENNISFTHNPFLFADMESFCERILQALEDGEKVHVFGDRDVDGMTSTALIVTELRNMGLEVSYSVPMGDEPYAFSKQAIDRIIEDNVTLAVTVDCGISCFDEIDYAQSKGLDFLVTDHHIAASVLPPAGAIINPKVEGCGYPFRDLSGVGVVAKCIWALRFAQTEYYREPIVILHAIPGNATVVIEAAKLENLIVTERICEEVVPGILDEHNSRIISFLNCNLPVFVLDKEEELIQLRKAFPKAEIHLNDLRPQFEKYLPFVREKSLFALNSASRFALYSNVRSELDTLIGLFGAFVRSSQPSLYKKYLEVTDLVAIGTISDLMPMTDENRILVRSGLRALENSSRLSLIPFMSIQNLLGKKLSTTDISWQISPLLNAAGRMGKPDIAINMLLCEDQHKSFELAQELVQLNKERQHLGEKCWDRLLPQAKTSFEEYGTKFVFIRDDKIPRGITGILATRFQKVFKAPIMVVTQTEDLRAVGSLRSPTSFNCHDFLSRFSDLFDDFGGHDCAGGFTLDPSKIDELEIRISEELDYMDCPDTDNEEYITVDAGLSPELFTEKMIKTVERFEPYGEKNEPLIFMIEGARIENLSAIVNKKDAASNHLKMDLSYGSYKWPSVFWSAGSRVGKDFNDGDIIDAVFRLGRNYFRNQELIQLTLVDIRRH